VGVRLPDGLQLAIPEWMLDQELSERMTNEVTPRIAIDALVELRRLIDAQPPTDEVRNCAQSATGGADAQQRESGSAAAAAEASLRRRRGLGTTSRASARTLSNSVGPAPGKRSQRGRTETE
jgi:hypothetical protein